MLSKSQIQPFEYITYNIKKLLKSKEIEKEQDHLKRTLKTLKQITNLNQFLTILIDYHWYNKLTTIFNKLINLTQYSKNTNENIQNYEKLSTSPLKPYDQNRQNRQNRQNKIQFGSSYKLQLTSSTKKSKILPYTNLNLLLEELIQSLQKFDQIKPKTHNIKILIQNIYQQFNLKQYQQIFTDKNQQINIENIWKQLRLINLNHLLITKKYKIQQINTNSTNQFKNITNQLKTITKQSKNITNNTNQQNNKNLLNKDNNKKSINKENNEQYSIQQNQNKVSYLTQLFKQLQSIYKFMQVLRTTTNQILNLLQYHSIDQIQNRSKDFSLIDTLTKKSNNFSQQRSLLTQMLKDSSQKSNLQINENQYSTQIVLKRKSKQYSQKDDLAFLDQHYRLQTKSVQPYRKSQKLLKSEMSYAVEQMTKTNKFTLKKKEIKIKKSQMGCSQCQIF